MGRAGDGPPIPHAADDIHRALADLDPPPVDAPAGARLYALCGLPASGKSHVARALQDTGGVWRVSSDRIRQALDLHPGDHRAHGIAHEVARQLLHSGHRVCLDANAATARVRAQVARLAAECGAELRVIHVMTPPAVRAARMQARRDGQAGADEVVVPAAVLQRMERGFEPPADALVVDGTGDLAELRHELDAPGAHVHGHDAAGEEVPRPGVAGGHEPDHVAL